MKYLKLNLSKKMSITYLIIVIATIFSSLFCYYVLVKNKSADQEFRYVSMPSLEKLKEMKILMLEIKKHTNSWIYLSNKKDKARLTDIIQKDFNSLNSVLKKFALNWKDDKEISILDALSEKNKIIMASVKNITNKLATDDDYNDDEKVDYTIQEYDSNVSKNIDSNNLLFENLIKIKEQNLEILQNNKSFLLTMLSLIVTILLVVVIGVSIFSMIFTKRSVINPLIDIKNIISDLSLGQVKSVEKNDRTDEIGQMQNAISDMIEGLKQKIIFSEEIGKGNYNSEFHLLSQDDKVGAALIEMRNNLQKGAIADYQRNWNSSGLAELAAILRLNHNDENLFYNDIIRFIAKYCKANQSSLFILNDSNSEFTLELVACYAYDKRKYLQKSISIGEGLVGQCYIEKDIIYLTDVPDKYTYINSGIGEATPGCIVLIPLKVNENINGVIELASFIPLEEYQVEFLKKAAESISSTVVSLKINSKTSVLLEQTQQQAEEMRAQEEEMRQNLEELQATQEESERKEIETQKLRDREVVQQEEMMKTVQELTENMQQEVLYKDQEYKSELDKLKMEIENLKNS